MIIGCYVCDRGGVYWVAAFDLYLCHECHGQIDAELRAALWYYHAGARGPGRYYQDAGAAAAVDRPVRGMAGMNDQRTALVGLVCLTVGFLVGRFVNWRDRLRKNREETDDMPGEHKG